MDIRFKTKKLARLCNSSAEMNKKFGPKRARKLATRLAELRAAICLDDISRTPPARCHELTGDLKGCFSVDLDHPYRLLFRVSDDPPPKLKDGGWDWANVKQIEILEIKDTH